MNISEKKFQILFNSFLLLLAITLIFRLTCTKIIIAFVVFGLFFIKKLEISKKSFYYIIIIAIPLLLEILFFWNNDSLKLGLKSMEKSTSLLIFPLFIIGNYKYLNFNSLLKKYAIITTLFLLFFFIRFSIIDPHDFYKYLKGIELWEMGYVFSKTIGIHAPALNMHLAFVSIINLYFLLKSNSESILYKVGIFIVFILSFFFVLYINTRIALICMILGYIIVLFYEFVIKKANNNLIKLIVIILSLGIVFTLFISKYTYMKEKYTNQIFANFDKIGKLDEFKDPVAEVSCSFVTRLSIWKSVIELSDKNLLYGVGSSDSKNVLNNYFVETNQKFLAQQKFPTHNQYLDFLLKFGILGLLGVFVYLFFIFYLGIKIRNPIIISFFLLFFISNLTDDFLIRFDGITFSGFWISIFSAYFIRQNNLIKN
jgi:O-antigen ligase